MGSLEDVLNAIERRIRIILLAYRLGLYNFEYKGVRYWIVREGDRIEINSGKSDEGKFYLGMDKRSLRDIACLLYTSPSPRDRG